MVCIRACGITRKLLFKVLLHKVPFWADSGQLVALIGPSGSGKTTLLNILALLDSRYRGSLFLDNTDAHSREIRRFWPAIGYVHQFAVLHPGLKVVDTLYYTYCLRQGKDRSKREILRQVQAFLQHFAMADKAGQRLRNLSGGERRRVHIINELLAGPNVLFLDEPLSGLDPANSRVIMKLLAYLAKGGKTVVFTTHSSDSLAFCEHLFFLHKGSLVFWGSPERMYGYFNSQTVPGCYEKVLAGDRAYLAGRFRQTAPYRRLLGHIARPARTAAVTAPGQAAGQDRRPQQEKKRRQPGVDEEFNNLLNDLKGRQRDDA